jgi:nucleotide-binding universal stress UspA family protein
VRDDREARTLGWFGAALAKARGGGLLAVHMLEVPRPLSLNEGRALIESGRAHFETVRDAAKARRIETHTLIMIARRVAYALGNIVADRTADFIVLGWNGTSKRGRTYGRTIDPLLADPPADLAVIRPAARSKDTVRTILVPVEDSDNSRLAIELAVDLGRQVAGRAHAAITVLRVTSTKAAAEEGETALFERLLKDIEYGKIERKTEAATSAANAILEAAQDHDLLILGASETRPFGRLFPRRSDDRLSDRTIKRLLRDAKPATVMVERRPAVLRSFLRRTFLSG